ncbi:unnamed protein product [Adineta steineri]|uniref:Homeobox domain-containing protein n=1 Tax=Adineta steineri TaxID=433720 RepID=A0A815S600_9BILA|nr:unnamed protein product [Adineta steineri]CAF1484726.1 unnamed protein product [Adineta steineri]CAF1509177.1 unnamed protein product [Adineta steineri]CAF1646812.1 unnamed protein product [Adineta steineri]CAF3666078.1 unnamed protein product [Adineta steineri]
MEDDRSTSPSSIASSDDEHHTDLPEVQVYQPTFNPFWFPFTPLRNSPLFNSLSFQQPIRSATPIVRHNFKSIDDLLSPIPNSISSTPSQRNDDTGYSSQYLSASLLSLRQSRESTDSSQENEDDIENIKPTTSSSPIVDNKKQNNESKNNKSKKIRTAFTDHQKLSLDRFYSTNRYPDPTQMETLSRLLSLEEKVIRVWFQNKRSREKNHPRNQLSIHQQPNPTAAMAMWQQFSSSPNFPH